MRGSNRCFRSTAKLSPRRHPRERGDRTGVSGIPPSSLPRHPRECGDPIGVSGVPPSSPPDVILANAGIELEFQEYRQALSHVILAKAGIQSEFQEYRQALSHVILANAGIELEFQEYRQALPQTSSSRTRGSILEVQNTSQLEQTPSTKKPEHGLRFFVPRLLLKPGTVRPASEPASCRLRRAACQP